MEHKFRSQFCFISVVQRGGGTVDETIMLRSALDHLQVCVCLPSVPFHATRTSLACCMSL
jgi:hypothetical protein